MGNLIIGKRQGAEVEVAVTKGWRNKLDFDAVLPIDELMDILKPDKADINIDSRAREMLSNYSTKKPPVPEHKEAVEPNPKQ